MSTARFILARYTQHQRRRRDRQRERIFKK